LLCSFAFSNALLKAKRRTTSRRMGGDTGVRWAKSASIQRVGRHKEPRLRLEVRSRRATASSRSSTRSSYCTSSSPWCPTASCAHPCAYRSPSKARTVLRRGRASGSSTKPPNGRQTVSSEPTSQRRGGCPQMLLRMVSWLRPVGSGDNDCMLLQRVQRS
jgi:hypothetical protein